MVLCVASLAMSLVLKHVLNVQNVSTVRVLKEIARNQFLVLKATTVQLGLESHNQNAPPEHTILRLAFLSCSFWMNGIVLKLKGT